MTTPTIINNIDGHPVVAGPADTVRAALNGTQPITITGPRATGDTVWLAPRTDQVWRNDAVTVEQTSVARAINHPQHGEILYAWIDTSRLDSAPQLAELERTRKVQQREAQRAQDRRIAETVPACDNCGDCAKCC